MVVVVVVMMMVMMKLRGDGGAGAGADGVGGTACNWDGGMCNALFEEAGAEVGAGCERQLCQHWREQRGNDCHWECFRASC